MKSVLPNLLLFSFPLLALSQTPYPWDIGMGVGITMYHGEINDILPDFKFTGTRPSASIQLRRNLSNNFSAKAGLLYTAIAGDDKHHEQTNWRHERGISFQSSVVEMSVMGEIYPWGLYKKRKRGPAGLSKTRKSITPFLGIGLGGFYTKADVNWNDANGNPRLNATLAQQDKDSPQKLGLSLPVGAGVRFRADDHLSLGFEAFVRPTLSDYLDGISKAGEPGSNDWFVTAQVSLGYAFGKDQKKQPKPSENNETDPSSTSDRDGDGVPDDYDECPDDAGPRHLRGCPDADRDGIPDKDDHCPEEAGTYILHGCPDRDGDGIPDKDDHCPDLKGVAAYNGCPAIDRDKDGVADAEDLCPDMPGEARWKGCPDSDGDGIPDNKDACPGIAGPAHLNGCPDTDGDGIADKDDECPTIPGTIENKGCPTIPPPSTGVDYKAVYFGSTLQDWHNTSVTTLNEVMDILKADITLFARLEGHTDDTGREPANDLLAEKRAKRCLDYLVAQGVNPKRLNYLGYGSHRPAVPNDSRQNRQLNRRVEIHFYRKE